MTSAASPMKVTSPTLHITILLLVTAFVNLLAMSVIFRVEIVARGTGRVVPVGRVQVIQTEFPGKITAIHVKNGSIVRQGDVLLELDPTEVVSELDTIRAEQDRLLIELARIEALVAGLAVDPDAPDYTAQMRALFQVPDRLAEHPFAQEQENLLLSEADNLRYAIARIAARGVVNQRSEAVTNANVARIDAVLEIQSQRLAISDRLLQQGATSRSAFLDAQQAFTELERERSVYLRELEQKTAFRQALEHERRQLIASERSFKLQRRAEIDARLAILTGQERITRRRVEATTLRAPVAGVVEHLTVFTVGGVSDAGAELMRIVPTDVGVEIEAIFSNQDIGFITHGQIAHIRLDAYPSERFGFVRGSVSGVAADSTEIATGQWGYVVHVAPDGTFLTSGADRLALRPGMTATIDINTDSRRIISYFFAPIVKAIQDALGER